jgi:hypothetical protein
MTLEEWIELSPMNTSQRVSRDFKACVFATINSPEKRADPAAYLFVEAMEKAWPCPNHGP